MWAFDDGKGNLNVKCKKLANTYLILKKKKKKKNYMWCNSHLNVKDCSYNALKNVNLNC